MGRPLEGFPSLASPSQPQPQPPGTTTIPVVPATVPLTLAAPVTYVAQPHVSVTSVPIDNSQYTAVMSIGAGSSGIDTDPADPRHEYACCTDFPCSDQGSQKDHFNLLDLAGDRDALSGSFKDMLETSLKHVPEAKSSLEASLLLSSNPLVRIWSHICSLLVLLNVIAVE